MGRDAGLSSGGFLREWSDFPQGALLGIAYLRLQQEELVAGQRAWLLELLLSERVGRELVQLHNLGVAVQRARLLFASSPGRRPYHGPQEKGGLHRTRLKPLPVFREGGVFQSVSRIPLRRLRRHHTS